MSLRLEIGEGTLDGESHNGGRPNEVGDTSDTVDDGRT